MRKSIIIDLDGTYCNIQHRLHHVLPHGKKRDWDAFFAGISDDKMVSEVDHLVRLYVNDGYYPIFASGRPDTYRETTRKWLYVHPGYGVYPPEEKPWLVSGYPLYMRKEGDHRPDHVVKYEMLQQMRADGFDPKIAIDDRDSIVEMWRSNGIFTFQVKSNEVDHCPDTARLDIMVGPSGAGKSSWLIAHGGEYGIRQEMIVSSDDLRESLTGDFRNQDKNSQVFSALHDIVKTRIRHGLPTCVDATNIRNVDRKALVNLVPSYVPVRYFVIDRPKDEKYTTAGWRADLEFDLISKHQSTFNSNIKDILAGDGFTNVTVIDMRR